MAPIQAVLVSSPDEDVVSSLTATLRDRWPTRTATSPDETTRSLDENVTVVVFDTAFAGLSLDDLAAMTTEQSPDAQVLQLGTSMDPNAGRADAVLTHAVETDTICSTVDRLQRRARYNRLLSRFYSLSLALEVNVPRRMRRTNLHRRLRTSNVNSTNSRLHSTTKISLTRPWEVPTGYRSYVFPT